MLKLPELESPAGWFRCTGCGNSILISGTPAREATQRWREGETIYCSECDPSGGFHFEKKSDGKPDFTKCDLYGEPG